ncbi:hypothetical protein F5883DRAFT_623154 [Diaporthe sp. PMI_573]|nr:hypothetical protein F5883DRAFT_623154 [Diaporthaceae sp. PMI_573]
MSNENGTRLARQVRRFIENNPAAKSLENVTEDAKRIILEIGNPDYFVDKSEEFEPFPPEWRVKKSFESQYKKLQKEYPNLPDLKGKATQIENTKEKADDEAKKAREAADEEANKKADDEAKKAREAADEEAKKAREAADEEANKKADDEAKKAREAADDEAKKAREAADDEAKTSALRDQLKSMDPEQLQGLLQDLEISSGRGSRETTADTTSSWNTRGSGVDPTSSDSGHWRKVRETFGEDTEYWLNKLSVTSKENDCDFADVKFYLEYLLRQDADRSVSDLGGLALEFVSDCPASQAQFVKELRDKDPQLNRAYNTYHASSRISGEKERRPWARNPQVYRDRIFEGLPPERDEEWDRITLAIDPDTGKKNIKGRITASIAGFLDVCLDSLLGNGEERHHLVPKSDYPKEAQRFEGSKRGGKFKITPSPKETFNKREKSDFKILNYSCAEQTYPDMYPRMYFVGIDKKDKTTPKAWARSSYCWYTKFKGGVDDLNEQRKSCGQKDIVKISRPHRTWPPRSPGSDSDSDSDFQSDVELQ